MEIDRSKFIDVTRDRPRANTPISGVSLEMEVKRNSPEKSFTSTDRYTIKLPSCKRDLIIESALGGIENDPVNVLPRIRRCQTAGTTVGVDLSKVKVEIDCISRVSKQQNR
jgi:hypothetical protein